MFYQVTKHTDLEITQFLQRKAEEGLFLKKVSGNNFVFEKKPYDGNRLCALTLYAHGRDTSTELQVREELVYLRKKGWNSICVGRPETLNDSRRHVYLVEEKEGSDVPKADDRSEARARIRGRFKAFSNLLLCLLYIGAAAFVFKDSLIRVVTSNVYLFAAFFLVLFLSLCSILTALSFFNKEKYFDKSTLLTTVFLLTFAFFILLDSVFTDNGVSQRVKIGASSYNLYSDELPVRLEDLGGDTSGSYRTSRKKEADSFLASYKYCFDESFGVEPGETVYDSAKSNEVSFVTYTVFKSKSERLRTVVANQLLSETAIKSDPIAKITHSDIAFEATDGSIVLCKGDTVIFIKTGFELKGSSLAKFNKLFSY